MIRLGVVGPQDMVQRIENNAKRVTGEYEILEIAYEGFDQLQDLGERAANADVLLFSGQAPYYWVKENLNINLPMVYIPRNGTSLYRVLFSLYREGKPLSRISFDTIDEDMVREAYRDLDIPYDSIYVLGYSKYLPYDEVIKFHKCLFEKGKTDMAITCLRRSKDVLENEGIPTYRIYPTDSIIRESIERALTVGENERLKYTQVAFIKVLVKDLHDNNWRNRYKEESLLLEFNQMLLDYCEEHDAVVFRTGEDEFTIITTRGRLEDMQFYEKSTLLEKVKRFLNINASVGIGFGRTSIQAERNAFLAIEYSLKASGSCEYIILDDGKILGPIQPFDPINISGAGSLRLSKIKHALKIAGKDLITADELSELIHVSPRSARRILNYFVSEGLASCEGYESVYDRGRPRNKYRLKI